VGRICKTAFDAAANICAHGCKRRWHCNDYATKKEYQTTLPSKHLLREEMRLHGHLAHGEPGASISSLMDGQ